MELHGNVLSFSLVAIVEDHPDCLILCLEVGVDYGEVAEDFFFVSADTKLSVAKDVVEFIVNKSSSSRLLAEHSAISH